MSTLALVTLEQSTRHMLRCGGDPELASEHERRSVVAAVFGHTVQLAIAHLKSYFSDLHYVSNWLEANVTNECKMVLALGDHSARICFEGEPDAQTFIKYAQKAYRLEIVHGGKRNDTWTLAVTLLKNEYND